MSDDGKCVLFSSLDRLTAADTNGIDDLYCTNLETGTTELVGLDPSGAFFQPPFPFLQFNAQISGDGKWIVFTAPTGDPIPNQPLYRYDRIYLRDLGNHATTLLAPGLDGMTPGPSGGPSLSRDGRFVAFESGQSNVVPSDMNGRMDVFLFDRGTTGQ
jgi:Tol biopolymer transport system component